MTKSILRNGLEKWYLELCTRATDPNREHEEKHRIVPAYAGGKYVDGNVAYLTTREHIIAHMLLARGSRKNYRKSAWYAAFCMAGMRKGSKVSSKTLAIARKEYRKRKSIDQKGKPNNFNRPEVIKKCHETRKNNGTNPFVCNNPMHNPECVRKKVSKTSGELHYVHNKIGQRNKETGEYRYFEEEQGYPWVAEGSLKGKTTKAKGKKKKRNPCPFCEAMIPPHVMKRHIKAKHENHKD